MGSEEQCGATPRAVGGEPERRIKRYANRKLYDTRESRYITLQDVAEMVRRGDRVRIVDHRDGSDLTAVVLAQIVYEQQRDAPRPREGAVRLLRRFIEESGHKLVESLPVPRWSGRGEEGQEGDAVSEEAEVQQVEEAASSLLALAMGQLQQLQGEVRRLQGRIERLEERLRKARRRTRKGDRDAGVEEGGTYGGRPARRDGGR